MGTALTPATPPYFLQANASDSIPKVIVSWEPGGAPSGLYGYELQRKIGLPSSNNPFITVATTDLGPRIFEDYNVVQNQTYTYRVKSLIIGADSHYGNEATAYVPAIVPVELVSFNANIIEAGVNLNWTTATETNNRGFDVERKRVVSLQSSVSNTEWERIGFVEGRGTSTEAQTYSFVDEEVSSGKYQFRLKQIDFDGSYEYSNVVEVDVNLITEFLLEQNYPNPFNPTTKISWQLPVGSYQTIKVYDVLGNEVATVADEYREAGKYEIEFEAGNLSSGVYYYQLLSGDLLLTKKMLLLK
ncbi:MAG: T9SS type A sorting domain-containing protein [Ignavibacteriales bacterium]|nr:MAG: T9SS type A sorting domain-containing protein [Ignavibacteriales bacterium]